LTMHASRFVPLLSLMIIPAMLAYPQKRTPVRLWDRSAPGALGVAPKDIPTVTPYVPEAVAFPVPAVVIYPGGAYGTLAAHEGEDYALFLTMHGVAAFVLKYRLGTDGYRHPCMLEDAARALRLVRARAPEWNLDPERIGVMGSSAGGHLASTLLTHFDAGRPESSDSIERRSSRPDFGILCYPVISMGPLGHEGSRENLLGENPDTSLVRALSSELHVTPETPPCFIWHTWEDGVVKVENSLAFADALRKNGVPFDLHVYQKGEHGMGLGDKPPFRSVHPWAHDLLFWLKGLHLIR